MARTVNTEIFKVTSSNVGGIEYITRDGFEPIMRVTYKNGGVYDYTGVTREHLDEVINAESVGKAIHTIIKPNYVFEKLEDASV